MSNCGAACSASAGSGAPRAWFILLRLYLVWRPCSPQSTRIGAAALTFREVASMADEQQTPAPTADDDAPAGAPADAPAADDAKDANDKKKEEKPKVEKPPPAWMGPGTKPWDTTLFGCCSGPDAGNAICVVAYCPGYCCLTGESSKHAEFGNWNVCCLAMCFVPCCTAAMVRSKAVAKYKLQEPAYKTYPFACCCCPCSTVQVIGQIMIDEQKQFSDIIASTKLVDRAAGLAATKKLRASFLEDPRKAIKRWGKIDKLEAPLHKVMDRENRVDVLTTITNTTVATLCAEVMYEQWLENWSSKAYDEVMASIIEDEATTLGETVAAEARVEIAAKLLQEATEDIEKKAKKSERLGKLAKESADKDRIAEKKFGSVKKEIEDEQVRGLPVSPYQPAQPSHAFSRLLTPSHALP